jgi:hypothetical protein
MIIGLETDLDYRFDKSKSRSSSIFLALDRRHMSRWIVKIYTTVKIQKTTVKTLRLDQMSSTINIEMHDKIYHFTMATKFA